MKTVTKTLFSDTDVLILDLSSDSTENTKLPSAQPVSALITGVIDSGSTLQTSNKSQLVEKFCYCSKTSSIAKNGSSGYHTSTNFCPGFV